MHSGMKQLTPEEDVLICNSVESPLYWVFLVDYSNDVMISKNFIASSKTFTQNDTFEAMEPTSLLYGYTVK